MFNFNKRNTTIYLSNQVPDSTSKFDRPSLSNGRLLNHTIMTNASWIIPDSMVQGMNKCKRLELIN